MNQKDQIDGENTALGIIAALVSGICFGMLSLGSDGGEGTLGAYGEFAFVVLYSIAACNTLLASVFSVFIYLAVHETYDDDQAEYFLNLFDSTTFGMGSFAPLVLLESGCVSAALGIVVYLFHYFKLVTAIGATIGVAFGGTFFCQLVMQLTACLYSSHRLNKHILKHQSKRTLSAKDIGSAISTCKGTLY